MSVSSDLSDFVRRALQSGHSKDSIAAELTAAGWDNTEVTAALGAWQAGGATGPVPRPVRSSTALDAFFHALLFVGFGMVVGNLLTLAFGQWNYWLPEPGEVYSNWSARSLRWSMAAVIVFLPTFLVLDQRDAQRTRREPARRHGAVRRWLTALALFAAVTTLLGDALYLIYTWLDGQMTLRFLAKSATVAVVAGLTIAYFRRDATTRPRRGITPAAATVVALTVAALGLSLWTQGGPAQGRLEQVDRWRISDLRALSSDLRECNEIDRSNLPVTLDPMSCARNRGTLTGFASEVSYRRLGAQEYELCVSLDASERVRYAYGLEISDDRACLTGTTK
jgi:hypothetical protein